MAAPATTRSRVLGVSCSPIALCGGNDTLNGDAGNDSLDGQLGNDRLDGGNNTAPGDELIGDVGIDRALFSTCGSGATVTIDTDATSSNDDGCTDGSGDIASDDVHQDVESVTGTNFGDTITGNCFANTFAGEAGTTDGSAGGNDTLNGDPAAGCTAAAGSADFFGGGEGNDVFNGDGVIDGTHFPGFDTVTYGVPLVYSVAPGISVSLDDAANDNDGWGNATENVNGDIERLIGTAQDDTINATGADQDVQLFGRTRQRPAHGRTFQRPAERRGRYRHGQLPERRHQRLPEQRARHLLVEPAAPEP